MGIGMQRHAQNMHIYAQSNQNMSKLKTIFRHVPTLFLGTSQEQERARAERAAAATRAAAASSSSRERPSSAEEPAAKRRLRAVSTYGLPARVGCLDLKTEQVDTISPGVVQGV